MVEESQHRQEPSTLYHTLNSTELLARARDGDSNALEQLYYHFRDQVLKYVWLVSGNHDVAVSTVKKAFRKLFSSLEAEEQIQSVKQLLFTRAEQIRKESNDSDPITAQSGWELASDTLAGEGNWTGPSSQQQFTPSSERFVSCFSSMPEPLRAVAGLHLLGSFSVDDIMNITGESAEAIRARINEALRRLRVCLQSDNSSSPRTHTDECSMASERTWLQFHAGNSAPSGSSNLSRHKKKCEECETVSRGIKALNNHLNDFMELELSPFPKGDESDLLEEARNTAGRITTESPSKPDMDPDLKQVLWLIPWGLVLVFVLSITPLLIQNLNDSGFAPFTEQSPPTPNKRTVYLDSGEHHVKRISIRLRGKSTVLKNLQVQKIHPTSTIQQKSDVISKNSEMTNRTYVVHFSAPHPSSEIRMFSLTSRSHRITSRTIPEVKVIETTTPQGDSVSARVYFKE